MTTTPYASIRDYLVGGAPAAVAGAHRRADHGRWGVRLLADRRSSSTKPRRRWPATRPTQGVELIGLPPVREQTPEERAAVCAERANRRSLLESVQREAAPPRFDRESGRRHRGPRGGAHEPRRDHRRGRRPAAARRASPTRTPTRSSCGSGARSSSRYDQLIVTTRRVYRRLLKGNDPFTRFQRQQFEEQLVRLRTTRDFTRPVEVTDPATVPASPTSPEGHPEHGVRRGRRACCSASCSRSCARPSTAGCEGAREIEAEAQLPVLGRGPQVRARPRELRRQQRRGRRGAGPRGVPDPEDQPRVPERGPSAQARRS